MPTRLWSVVIDTAADPAPIARWWAEALSWPITFEDPGEYAVEPSTDNDPTTGVPSLTFCPVPEPKTVKNRVHLDLASQSLDDQRAIVERLIALGARPVDIGQRDVPWTVLADLEGNEFCVLDPRDRYTGVGPLAAIVVDALDPLALARFWEHASGWTIGYESEDAVSLHAPHGRPPDVDFVRVADAKTVKDRVHLDVAPFAEDDRDAEAQRLIDLGATPVDIGQHDDPETTWVVLADPEGNEFCVLRPR